MTGPTGYTGYTGYTGPTGPVETFDYRGIWDVTTSYDIGDVIFYDVGSFISLVNSNVGNTPTPGAFWGKIADVGSTGPTDILVTPDIQV